MNSVFGIKINISANSTVLKNVQNSFKSLNNTAKNTRESINSFSPSFKNLLIAGASVYSLKKGFDALLSSATSLINTASAFENYGAVLKTLMGSSQGAQKALEWVKEFASSTPYELDGVTEAFVKLKSYGIEPTDGTLKTLGDTSAAMGKPLIAAVEAMADAVTGENERLKEFGIKAKSEGEQIAYSWVDNSGRARTTIAQNNQTIIKDTLSAIFNEKYSGAMKNLSTTWSGLTSNLSDKWTNFKNDIATKSGLFDIAKKSVAGFIENFDKIGENETLIKSLGDAVINMAEITLTSIDYIKEPFIGWAYLIKGVETGITELSLQFEKVVENITLLALKGKKSFIELKDAFGLANDGEIEKINKDIAKSNLTLANLDVQVHKNRVSYSEFADSFKAVDSVLEGFKKSIKNAKDSTSELTEASIKKDKVIQSGIKDNTEALKDNIVIQKKENKEYFDFIENLSYKTALSQSESLNKPYIELNKQYEDNLKKYKEYAGSKEKIDAWYNAELQSLNSNTVTKFNNEQKESFDKQKQLLEDNRALRVKYYEKMGDYENAWGELKEEQLKKYKNLSDAQREEQLKKDKEAYFEKQGYFSSYFSALTKGIEDTTKEWNNYHQIVYSGFSNLIRSMQGGLEDGFVNLFEGKIKSVGGFFESMWDGVKKSFIKLIAEFASKAIIMSFKNSWSSGGSTGQGFIEKFLGIDIPFLNFAKGSIWGDGRYGVVDNRYVPYDSYKNDTIPALISPGEAVIPASAVSANRDIVSSLIKGGRLNLFSNGYIDEHIEKSQIDSTRGLFTLKGGGIFGGIGDFFGGIFNGLKDALSSIWGVVGKVIGGVGEFLSPILKPLMANSWIGWIGQAALALATGGASSILYPMLSADLLSGGLSLITGGSLGDALNSAGLSGLLAGAGSALGVAINGMPKEQLLGWQALKNYPEHLWSKITQNYSDVKSFFSSINEPSQLASPTMFTRPDLQDYLLNGEGLNYEEYLAKHISTQYASLPSDVLFEATSFGNNGSFIPYNSAYSEHLWGLPTYEAIGAPATTSTLGLIKENLLSALDFTKGLGGDAFSAIKGFIDNPNTIFQYILDNLGDVLKNIIISISDVASNPLVASLISNGFTNNKSPFNISDKVAKFADGGIVSAPTLGLIGEAGYKEAIIPLRGNDELGVHSLREEIRELKSVVINLLRSNQRLENEMKYIRAQGIKVSE